MVHRKIAVIGIGRFGESIAKNLSKKGAEVLAIDKLQENIERVSDDVSLAVAIDATDKKALLSQNIQEFDAVVVSIGESFEQRLLCVALLLDLGVKRIIARFGGKSQRIILEKLGVKDLWSPEEEVGAIVAERLLNPSVVSYLQLPDDYRIVEMLTPKKVAGRMLGDLDLRDRYKLSLITIKEETTTKVNNMEMSIYHVAGVPDSKYVIKLTDRLVLFGKNKDIDLFIQINE